MSFIQNVQEIRDRARRHIDEGAVTPALRADAEKTCVILNEALATELVCVLRYQLHYHMAAGIHAAAVKAEFKEHWDEEQRHADKIAERIRQLGGKPDFSPQGLSKSQTEYTEGHSLADMIREDLVAERIVIQTYSELIRYFADKDSTTRVLMQEILAEEEEHADDLADLLYGLDPSSGKPKDQLTDDEQVRPFRSDGEKEKKKK